jgi:hypothetical protein
VSRTEASTLFCGYAGGHSGVTGIVQAKADLFPRKLDIGFPAGSPIVPANPGETALVVHLLSAIAHVFRMRNRAEVTQPIVPRVAIDVVDFIRPRSIEHGPYHPMRCELLAENGSGSAPSSARRVQRWLSGKLSVPSRGISGCTTNPVISEHFGTARLPYEDTGLMVVRQKFAQKRGRDIGNVVHFAVSMLRFGQGLLRVFQTRTAHLLDSKIKSKHQSNILLKAGVATICSFALTACGENVRIVSIPTELTHCADEPGAPEIPAIDWSNLDAARAAVGLRDRLTLDFILGLRSAGADCRAKVAGAAAWNNSLSKEH